MTVRRSWLVVSAVAALAAFAVADAVRTDEPSADRPPRPAPSDTSEGSVGADLDGVLYYTDANCELRAVRLSDRRPVPVRRPWTDCRFAMSPRGRGDAAMEGSRWAGDEVTVASESDGSIAVASTATNGFAVAGFAPAFRPDGRLTFVGRGGVRALDLDCARVFDAATEQEAIVARCSELAIPRHLLRRAWQPQLGDRAAEPIQVRELAWLTSNRVVAIVGSRHARPARYDAVVLVAGRTYRRVTAGFNQTFSNLEVSPFRSFFGVRSAATGSVHLYTRDGDRVPLALVPEASSFSFSPDERHIAVAGRGTIHVLRLGKSGGEVARFGIAAAEVAWRVR